MNVSRETLDKLDLYCKELLKWNGKVNLVSRKLTAYDIMNDHINDSAQLAEYIESKDSKILDVGSGGGFPGMVLCILGYTNCAMVELIKKKCVFLSHVLTELNLKGVVVNGDVRKLDGRVDYVVSRAVTSIAELVKMSEKSIDKETVVLLHKSKEQIKKEIPELGLGWRFKLQEFQNKYKNDGVIIKISELERVSS